MPGEGTAKQIARWTALGALFLVPLAPLIVYDGFFFPFITGKAFYFRILVEIAVAAWALLCLLDKEYRPRFSWIGVAVVAFVLWMFVADAFAVNAEKAFWSNFERMEGWVLLIHLAGFFFAASAVLRVEKKWRAWFLTSLAVAVVVSFHGILQQLGDLPIHQGSTRIDSSFGNSAYFAVYLLFNVFIAAWLAATEKRAWFKWSLVAFALVEAVLLFFTETRGTVLGLVGALALAALLTLLTAGKRARMWAAGGLLILLVIAGSFYLARDSAFVKDTSVLDRVSSISIGQGEVRFTIWGMAWEGFLVRPVTGWGQEGFNYVFDRFYKPSLYGQESWFDRAHNAFIDWLAAGGLPGFLLFISLFASVVWLLWSRSELSRSERIALTGALAGYAIHDLFVFDNLYSYVYFFAILALVDSQVARPIGRLERAARMSASDGVAYGLPIALVLTVVAVWMVNVPDMQAASELITAISPDPAGLSGNIATFTDLVAHPGHVAQEIREQLVSFENTVVGSQSATSEEKQQIATLAVAEMGKQVARYPLDTREVMQLAYAYRAEGDVKDALAAALRATTLSPAKEEAWTTAGILAWDAGDTAAARSYFDKAYALGPQFPRLAPYAAAGAYAAGDPAGGDKILEGAYGTTTIDNDILVIAYYRSKDWPRLIRLWQLRAAAPSATAQTLFSLAAAYYAAGDSAKAVATIQEAVRRFPDAAASAAEAIRQIRSGAAGQ